MPSHAAPRGSLCERLLHKPSGERGQSEETSEPSHHAPCARSVVRTPAPQALQGLGQGPTNRPATRCVRGRRPPPSLCGQLLRKPYVGRTEERDQQVTSSRGALCGHLLRQPSWDGGAVQRIAPVTRCVCGSLRERMLHKPSGKGDQRTTPSRAVCTERCADACSTSPPGFGARVYRPVTRRADAVHPITRGHLLPVTHCVRGELRG